MYPRDLYYYTLGYLKDAQSSGKLICCCFVAVFVVVSGGAAVGNQSC